MPNLTLAQLQDIEQRSEAAKDFVDQFTDDSPCVWHKQCGESVQDVPALTKEVRRLRDDMQRIMVEASDIDKDKWPTQFQRIQGIVWKTLPPPPKER